MAGSSRTNRSKFLHLNAAITAVALCIACGSSKGEPATTSRACTPGEQRACACPNGALGVQVCNSDGSALGQCLCGGVSTGGASSTAPASSAGGTSAIGGASSNDTMTSSAGQSAANGGADPVGGASPAGGVFGTATTTAPSTSAAGGVSSSGGSTSTLIDTSVGGANTTGGVAPGGGAAGAPQTASGGETSTAGQPSSGGTTNVVQTSSVGDTGGSSPVSVCGNGVIEGVEGCDPAVRNNDLGDGCTPTCNLEPTCPAVGGGCTTTCGDGLVLGGEACDDGNALGGDGCSSNCQTEPGFNCVPAPEEAQVKLPMVVRDFNAGVDFEKGSVFATGLYYANRGLLKPTLDERGLKPVLNSTSGTYNGKANQDSGIASAASFSQWFDDKVTAPNVYHATSVTSLNLYRDASNSTTYSNRYGTNGDGLSDAKYKRTYGLTSHFCGLVGEEAHDANDQPIPCTYCPLDEDTTTPECDPAPASTDCTSNPDYLYCIQDGNYWYGVYVPIEVEGNPLFFPADGVAKPWSPSATAAISGTYDESWPSDPTSRPHNFSFTTEVRFWFEYDASQTYKLVFTGDDDSWVFVNKHLALDMGGIHLPVQGTLTIDKGQLSARVSNTYPSDSVINIDTVPDLGALEDGAIYEVVVFQAERQTNSSSYGISVTSNFIATPSVCTRTH